MSDNLTNVATRSRPINLHRVDGRDLSVQLPLTLNFIFTLQITIHDCLIIVCFSIFMHHCLWVTEQRCLVMIERFQSWHVEIFLQQVGTKRSPLLYTQMPFTFWFTLQYDEKPTVLEVLRVMSWGSLPATSKPSSGYEKSPKVRCTA